MRNSLAIIGSSIIHDNDIKEYIIRFFSKKNIKPDSIFLLEDSQKDFVFEIESLKPSAKNIYICADKKNYATIAKMCSTLTQDSLQNINDYLVPSLSSFTKGGRSFSVEYKEFFISVFCMDDSLEIEALLESNFEQESIHIFNLDLESARLFIEPLGESFDLTLCFYELINGYVVCDVKSYNKAHIDEFLNSVSRLLGDKIVIARDIAEYLIKKLSSNNQTLTFAESCTGGLLSYRFAKISGCSNILEGGIVSYSNRIKNVWLEVDESILNSAGAVSGECVEAMAKGALNLSGADFALSISGIAGPSGATPNKPVGTVFVCAISRDGTTRVDRYLFSGDRELVQQKSVHAAIYALVELIKTI